MKTISTFAVSILAMLIFFSAQQASAQSGTITVPGTANPWLAGQPDGATAAAGDTAPAESPVLVQLVDFKPGDEITFSATGSVNYGGYTPIDPPDGDNGTYRSLYHLGDSTNGGPENEIAGLNAPADSLIGVFLGPDAPSPGSAPTAFLNFATDGNVPGNIDYTSLAPAIAQPFFIGDGQTSSGTPQHITVPAGATRLFLGAMDGAGWYNNTGSFNVTIALASSAPPPPVAPAHGGLSAINFTVNGSYSPAYPPATAPVNGLADTVLQFAAQQAGTPAGLSVRVQATTTPNVESSWTDLPNSTSGRMTLDASTNQFLLCSNEYPHEQADPVYFRAIASASGYSDSISNVVGPFNLTSSTSRFSSRLDFTGNGPIADLYFRATESATPSGVSVRVQASTTPGNEGSWSDLQNGNAGYMTQSKDPKQFLLLVDNYPTTKGIYFRAIAAASGYVDSISNVMGPYDVTADVPPSVTVYTQPGLSGSGDGHDADHPIILTPDTAGFTAGVQSARAIKTVKLQVDGMTVSEYSGTGNPDTRYPAVFTTDIVPSDHIFGAVAIDDLGAKARAGTGATYVRIVPGPSSVKKERAAGSSATSLETAGHVYTAVTNFGFWDSDSTWKDENNNVGAGHPGPNDMAIIGKGLNIGIQTNVEAKAVTINGGRLTNGTGEIWALRVYGHMEISDLQINGPIRIIIDDNATCVLTDSSNIQFGQTGELFVAGTLQDLGSAGLVGANSITNQGRIHFVPPLIIPANAAIDPAAALRIFQANSVPTTGLIDSDTQALITNDGGTLIGNDGAGLVGNSGGTIVASGGGNIISTHGGGIVASGGGNIVASGGGNLITDGGSSIVASGGGNIVAVGGGNFQGSRNTAAESAETPPSGFIQDAGETNLSACTIVGPVTLNGGILSGTGFIQGDLTNNGGYIAPGHSAGAVAVLGNFSQGSNGATIIEAGGGSGGQFDSLQVGGTANLGGKLDVKLINGYTPDPADQFNPISYTTAAGSFASVSSNAQVTVNSTGVVATVDASAPQPAAARLLNISTRLSVQTGENVLIAGFIVTGPPGSTKKVMIRGLGPSLAAQGVPNTLADPLLELHNLDGSTIVNDDWQQGDTTQIPAGFAPSSDKESVIVATLPVDSSGFSSYTAVLRGANGELGVGLAELYDLDPSSAAQLANISTRGFVETGDNVMIGGVIVGGGDPAKILVRAIGPSLKDQGVSGALDDTTLELHDANGAVISNDDWRETQDAEIQATTIPPTSDRESAIVATLVPGNYTAIVRGKNNTTGVGLVEAYNLQ